MASIHFVKYFVVVIMNFYPLDEVGDIFPINSSPHCEKFHGVVIGHSSCTSV